MFLEIYFVDVPKLSISGSRDYKLMKSLAFLEKYSIDSFQGHTRSVQIW